MENANKSSNEITPVNIYKDVIEDIAKQKNLADVYSKIDAGAHVKAYKL